MPDAAPAATSTIQPAAMAPMPGGHYKPAISAARPVALTSAMHAREPIQLPAQIDADIPSHKSPVGLHEQVIAPPAFSRTEVNVGLANFSTDGWLSV